MKKMRYVTIHVYKEDTERRSRQLFRDVSASVRAGEHLLIMGNSGAGKSSLLRAVAGLWDRGAGEVRRPPTAETMCAERGTFQGCGKLAKLS